MACSAKQAHLKQISPRLLIRVTAALILTLWLTGQSLAAPETILTTLDGAGVDDLGLLYLAGP